MRYTVRAATANVRAAPGIHGAVIGHVVYGAIVTGDAVALGPERITGYDDPRTPEPARQSYGWVHALAPVQGYIALAWLEELPDDAPHPPVTPQTLTIRHTPRITLERFRSILTGAGSPAAPEADALWAACLARDCDPAVAMAFFRHESTYGTAGVARATKNWGNLRRSPGKRGVVRDTGRGPFAFYPTWTAGLMDWCDLLRGPIYEGDGLVTVAQVLPRYAPSSDGNAPARYAQAVCDAVNGWQEATP